MQAAEELGERVGIAEACRVLSVPRSSLYRARQPQEEPDPRPTPARALKQEQKAEVRTVLNSARFCDCAPREVYGTLLDEGTYYCHWRTMYRVLEEHDEVRERRDQCCRPAAPKPRLEATGPNQVWSWDIACLKGANGTRYYLYVIIDVYSRYVVGWMVAREESGELAEQLILETCAKQGIDRDQLTLHADRGSAMRSKAVAKLLRDLGVAKSHSRPYTPTDNAYSEAHFKTLKYRPDYPKEFATIAEARQWARAFFRWYNEEHHHTGLGLMTPSVVHYGEAEKLREERQQVLDAAYAAHPERFVGGRPQAPEPPRKVSINQASQEDYEAISSGGPAARDREPGTQDESRAMGTASLDADKRLAILEQALDQPEDVTDLHFRLTPELSQSR